MDAFIESLAGLASLSIAISFIALLLLYLTIRVAVMHALRDHVKWVEKRRDRESRSTYWNGQRFPPITPESPSSF